MKPVTESCHLIKIPFLFEYRCIVCQNVVCDEGIKGNPIKFELLINSTMLSFKFEGPIFL
jgi:hypothetical protein